MTINIPEDKIRAIIWKWWENVQRLENEYDVKISIADDWITTITAKNQEWWNKAISEINEMLWIPTVGYKWVWVVSKIIDWTWAIVDFRWKSWMIHISKLAPTRVAKVEDIVKLWDSVEFEILQVDLDKWRIWLKKIFKEEKKSVNVVKK
jgi:polyribonucleotide nucleotidyltransferase